MHGQFPNFRLLIFVPVFFHFQCYLFGQSDNFHPQSFNNIGLESGLSNLSVSSFCEDDLGYIWVGTSRGIDRFDGNSFEHFFFNEKDSSSLYNDFITSLIVKDKQLFIGTINGLNKYDIEKMQVYVPKDENYVACCDMANLYFTRIQVTK